MWALGHNGIKGNEEADIFVKEGANTSIPGYVKFETPIWKKNSDEGILSIEMLLA